MVHFDNMQAAGLTSIALLAKDGDMTRTHILLTLAAAAALAGCNKEDHNIVGGPEIPEDPTNVALNGPVELPPSIVSSKVYRCADNKIVYVSWLSDNKSATIRTEQNGAPTQVTAPEAGQPMSAPGGYSLSGNASESSAKIAVPGHPSQSCKA
jgi:hypothetical protein